MMIFLMYIVLHTLNSQMLIELFEMKFIYKINCSRFGKANKLRNYNYSF